MTHEDTPARALAARMALPLARIMDTRHAAERAAHVAQILTLGEIDATPLEVVTAVCVHARRPNGGGARYIDERATVGEIEAALAEVVAEWDRYEWSGLMDGDAMLSGGRSHQGVSR